MTHQPVFVPANSPDLQVMKEAGRAGLRYRLLIDADGGPSSALCQGLFYIDSGHADSPHHHDVPETIHVIEGKGFAILGDKRQELSPGDTLFIPAGLVHGFEAPESMILLFTFPVERFSDVTYHDAGNA
ncbi:cupin domain-containing protein [Citreimonas salinaria]|uniref:Cupin domain protein n=1 Tax=Citreimonas salinaria TaxID=321339 RepID=A0A1H3JHW6_9RHOB|nr:cupin domain-containing protein [Citreimonas salinaria]SDY39521.1 Cupin domain protein [Citreimonas salinaria]